MSGVKTIVSTENLSRPGEEPADGDQIRHKYSDGTGKVIVYQEESIGVDTGDTFIITVAAFLDRLDIGSKLDTVYAWAQSGKSANPPDMTLYKYLTNLKQRRYIDLNDPRLRTVIESLNLYTEDDLTAIFAPATFIEIPAGL